MKILVIDDSPVHAQAARDQLGKEHELTVVTSYDQGIKCLEQQYDQEAIKKEFVAQGFAQNVYGGWQRPDELTWDEFEQKQEEVHKTHELPYWDVVLVDLMMPASTETLNPQAYTSAEMPYGFPLALLAALRGTKYVAVVTATNHHFHAMSASLDRLSSAYWTGKQRPNFTINGAKAMFVKIYVY